MSHSVSAHAAPPPSDKSLGELFAQMSEQTSRLIRDELRLAQLEMAQKGKRAGAGAGLLGGAGLFGFFGLACLVTAAILALAGPLTGWLAAVIVALALFVIAGIAALIGKRQVSRATPPIPTEAVEGVKQDVQTIKPGSHS